MSDSKVDIYLIPHTGSLESSFKSIERHLDTVNAKLARTNTAGTKGAKEHGSAVNGLAMRFAGFNLILNEAMKMQRKVAEHVAESVKKFREFETRIAEVSTILGGEFANAMHGLQAGVESLSLSFGKNTSDMAKGLYDILSAAFSANEAIALLGTSTKAAIAGLSSVRDSVDIFTTVLNTYGMSAYEATAVSDTLFQSVVRGKFQFQELESALGFIVPIAAQAGISFDELMASLSTATRHGLHLDMAARGLALAIQNVINPSAQAAAASRKYGLQLDGLSLRIKGLQGFFKELNEATKIYGKQVLNDIIPNMRSLRVAMILAGDEGVQGLADDLDYLTAAAGRTNEALEIMMNTSGFVSNQITQEWEKTQREVGSAWDKLILGGQRVITDAVASWTHYIPVVGGFYRAIDGWQQQQMWNWQREAVEKSGLWDMDKGRLETMKGYLQIQSQIRHQSQVVEEKRVAGIDYSKDYEKLEFLQGLAVELQDGFNAAFGEPILGGARNLLDVQLLLEEIEIDVLRLRDNLIAPISVGWGDYTKDIKGQLYLTLEQKKAEQARVDTMYDVDQAMRSSTYTWKTNNQEVKDAVAVMREYEDAQKEAKKATNELNRAMVQLQIEALGIQIKGMMRRRGLTRSEEKRLKQIQIEQAKLRLEGMKAEFNATEVTENAYDEKKQFVDDYINTLKHEEYTLKYALDTEIEDLELTIAAEWDLLQDRKEQWAETSQEINDIAAQLYADLADIVADSELFQLFKAHDIDILELFQRAGGALSGGSTFREIFGDFFAHQGIDIPGYSRGTEYVPETRPAMLHRGESVVPAGRNSSSGVTIGNVTVLVTTVSDIDSTEKLGRVLSEASDKGVINTGTVRARNKNTGNTYRVI